MSIAPCCVHPIWHVMQFKYIRIERFWKRLWNVQLISVGRSQCALPIAKLPLLRAGTPNKLEVIGKFSIIIGSSSTWNGMARNEKKKKTSPKWSCANLKSALKHQNNYVFMSPSSRALCIRRRTEDLTLFNWLCILPENACYYLILRHSVRSTLGPIPSQTLPLPRSLPNPFTAAMLCQAADFFSLIHCRTSNL